MDYSTSGTSSGGLLMGSTTPVKSLLYVKTATFGSPRTPTNNINVRVGRGLRNVPSYSCAVPTNIEKEFPMFIAMADLCITPTGFSDITLREAVFSKIQLMCGEISMAYTSRTTHLLAAHANTTKVGLAKERKLPVVTMDWVENVWNACQQSNPYIHASLPQFQVYDFPLFFNLHFVFSKRYTQDSKQFYENLLIMNGAFVGTTLRKAPNYFYVCQEPENDRLYHFAQSREIACVPLAWIIESVNQKTLAKISEFEVRGDELVGFGTTFDFGNIASELDPCPPQTAVSLNKTYDMDPQSITDSGYLLNNWIANGVGDQCTPIEEISNRISDNDIEMGADKVEEECGNTSDDAAVTLNDDTKENFVDSLSFSMAG